MNKEKYEACLEQIKLFMEQEDITQIHLINGKFTINYRRARSKNVLSRFTIRKQYHISPEMVNRLISDLEIVGKTVYIHKSVCAYRKDVEVWLDAHYLVPDGFVTRTTAKEILGISQNTTDYILRHQKEIDRVLMPIRTSGTHAHHRIVYRKSDIEAFRDYCRDHECGMSTKSVLHFKTDCDMRIDYKTTVEKYHISSHTLKSILRTLQAKQFAYSCNLSDARKFGGGWVVNRTAFMQAIYEYQNNVDLTSEDDIPSGWLNIAECAKLFGLNRNCMRMLLNKYNVPYKTVRRGCGLSHHMFDPCEVEKMLQHYITTSPRASIKPTFPVRLPSGSSAKSFVHAS